MDGPRAADHRAIDLQSDPEAFSVAWNQLCHQRQVSHIRKTLNSLFCTTSQKISTKFHYYAQIYIIVHFESNRLNCAQ